MSTAREVALLHRDVAASYVVQEIDAIRRICLHLSYVAAVRALLDPTELGIGISPDVCEKAKPRRDPPLFKLAHGSLSDADRVLVKHHELLDRSTVHTKRPSLALLSADRSVLQRVSTFELDPKAGRSTRAKYRTQEACSKCHENFRKRVADPAELPATTSTALYDAGRERHHCIVCLAAVCSQESCSRHSHTGRSRLCIDCHHLYKQQLFFVTLDEVVQQLLHQTAKLEERYQSLKRAYASNAKLSKRAELYAAACLKLRVELERTDWASLESAPDAWQKLRCHCNRASNITSISVQVFAAGLVAGTSESQSNAWGPRALEGLREKARTGGEGALAGGVAAIGPAGGGELLVDGVVIGLDNAVGDGVAKLLVDEVASAGADGVANATAKTAITAGASAYAGTLDSLVGPAVSLTFFAAQTAWQYHNYRAGYIRYREMKRRLGGCVLQSSAGIAGSFAGAAAGAAVGSMLAPGPGTVVGGIVGAAAGGVSAGVTMSVAYQHAMPPITFDKKEATRVWQEWTAKLGTDEAISVSYSIWQPFTSRFDFDFGEGAMSKRCMSVGTDGQVISIAREKATDLATFNVWMKPHLDNEGKLRPIMHIDCDAFGNESETNLQLGWKGPLQVVDHSTKEEFFFLVPYGGGAVLRQTNGMFVSFNPVTKLFIPARHIDLATILAFSDGDVIRETLKHLLRDAQDTAWASLHSFEAEEDSRPLVRLSADFAGKFQGRSNVTGWLTPSCTGHVRLAPSDTDGATFAIDPCATSRSKNYVTISLLGQVGDANSDDLPLLYAEPAGPFRLCIGNPTAVTREQAMFNVERLHPDGNHFCVRHKGRYLSIEGKESIYFSDTRRHALALRCTSPSECLSMLPADLRSVLVPEWEPQHPSETTGEQLIRLSVGLRMGGGAVVLAGDHLSTRDRYANQASLRSNLAMVVDPNNGGLFWLSVPGGSDSGTGDAGGDDNDIDARNSLFDDEVDTDASALFPFTHLRGVFDINDQEFLIHQPHMSWHDPPASAQFRVTWRQRRPYFKHLATNKYLTLSAGGSVRLSVDSADACPVSILSFHRCAYTYRRFPFRFRIFLYMDQLSRALDENVRKWVRSRLENDRDGDKHHHHKSPTDCVHKQWATDVVDLHHHHTRGTSLPHNHQSGWVTSSQQDVLGRWHHHHKSTIYCEEHADYGLGPPCYLEEKDLARVATSSASRPHSIHHHHRLAGDGKCSSHREWATDEMERHHHHQGRKDLPDHGNPPQPAWVTSSERDKLGNWHHHHKSTTNCEEHGMWTLGPACYINERERHPDDDVDLKERAKSLSAMEKVAVESRLEDHHHHEADTFCLHHRWATDSVGTAPFIHHHHRREEPQHHHDSQPSWATSSDQDELGRWHHHHKRGNWINNECAEHNKWALGKPCYIGEDHHG